MFAVENLSMIDIGRLVMLLGLLILLFAPLNLIVKGKSLGQSRILFRGVTTVILGAMLMIFSSFAEKSALQLGGNLTQSDIGLVIMFFSILSLFSALVSTR